MSDDLKANLQNIADYSVAFDRRTIKRVCTEAVQRIAELEEIRQSQEDDLIVLHAKLDAANAAIGDFGTEFFRTSRHPGFVFIPQETFDRLAKHRTTAGEGGES